MEVLIFKKTVKDNGIIVFYINHKSKLSSSTLSVIFIIKPMSDYKNHIARELGVKIKVKISEDVDPDELGRGIEDERSQTGDDDELAKKIAQSHLKDDDKFYSRLSSQSVSPSPRDRVLSPTAVMPQVLAVAVRGSNTGGLPSGNNMSRGKLGGYEPIPTAKQNSLVVDKTPESNVIENPAPIATDGGVETTPGEEHPHQTQNDADQPPQAVTGASTDDTDSSMLKAALPQGIDVDVAEDCSCEHEEEPKEDHAAAMNEIKGIPTNRLYAVRKSLQEKAQKGTMTKKESEVFSCITEVLQKRGLGLEQKMFGKKTMLETAGVSSKEKMDDKLAKLKDKKDDEKARRDHKSVMKKLEADVRRDDLA